MTTSQHVPDGYDVCVICSRICPTVSAILAEEDKAFFARLAARKESEK